MRNTLFKKGLVVGIIILFVGVSLTSALNNNIVNLSNIIDEVKESSKKIIILFPDDTEITHNSPNINYGYSLEIGIRNEYGVGGTSGWACDGLIKFNLSKIPAGSTIKSARLYLYYYRWQDNYPAGRKLNLYRITNDWDEDTVTWNTAPSYNQIPTANSSVPSTVNIWMEWDVKSDVKDFISGTPNYGWRLIDDDYWGMANIPLIVFRTKEFSNNLSSYLEIEYTNSRNKNVNHPQLEYLKQIKDILSYDKDTSDNKENCIECQSNGKTHLAEKLLNRLERNEGLSKIIDLSNPKEDPPICDYILDHFWYYVDLMEYYGEEFHKYQNGSFMYRYYKLLGYMCLYTSFIYLCSAMLLDCDTGPYYL